MGYGDYPDLTDVKKILVIKLRQLGDVLLTAPVLTVLKKYLPQARVDAYVYTESFPLMEGVADGLIGYDRKWKNLGIFQKISKEWALLKRIRKEKYDLVINLTEGDRGGVAAKVSGAKIRVGFKPKGKLQKSFYTHIVKHCPTLRHTVERNLDALRRIGIFPSMEERELSLSIPDWARKRVLEKVKGPFILIHPTSRWRFKCWPIENMRELTKKLLEKGLQVVFSSGPDEKESVDKIAEGLNVINLAGSLQLKELAALIERSECLLCVDSVPFHIASALKKQVIALFGPTSEVTWGPWRNPNATILTQNMSCRPCYQDGCGGSKVSDCLVAMSVEKVMEALEAKIFPQVRAARLSIFNKTRSRS